MPSLRPRPDIKQEFGLCSEDFYTRDREDLNPDPAPKGVQSSANKAGGRAKLTSSTPRTAADGHGCTAGTLNAFWVCGYLFSPLEMILSESTTLVRP